MEQQILISRLRSNLVTFRGASSGTSLEAGASGNSAKRPHSASLIRHSCRHGPTRKVGIGTVLCVRVCVCDFVRHNCYSNLLNTFICACTHLSMAVHISL